jgi:hypothetical protein
MLLRGRRQAPSPNVVRAAVFLAAFAIYLASPVLQITDSRYTLLTSEAILLHHSVDLASFNVPEPAAEHPDAGVPGNRARTYQLRRVKAGIVTYFPHGSAILSVPFVAVMNLFGLSAVAPDGTYSLVGAMRMQKLMAAMVTAALAGVLFDAAALMLPLGWAIVAAFGAAFGTQLWSTASRGMWSHTWAAFLAGCVVYELVSAQVRGRDPRPVLTSSLLCWAYFARPTASVPIVCVAAYIALFHRKALPRFVATGLVWLGALVAYSRAVFGTALPPYFRASRLAYGTILVGLHGNLISPSRGVLITVPILAWVFFIIARYWNTIPARRLCVLALAIVGLHALAVSSHPEWWGGRSYGARFFTDAVPWFFLLAILGIRAMLDAAPSRGRVPTLAAGAILLVLSVAINARGALSYATLEWVDRRPTSVPTAAFEWNDPQFLAGMFGIR